ncbi:hypothetical protein G7046_g7221 [Stylonectria norvegica]|nr:hypothetical protein G7046_g7221 [Stylonectria norvegica]
MESPQEPSSAAFWRRLTEYTTEQLNIPLPVLTLVFSVFAIAFSALLINITRATTAGQPRRFSVPQPKLPDRSSTVDVAAVKVSGSSAVQCYAPATGQFLGLVNPSTPAAIDRAVAAADAAQRKWAETSFAERKTVLRTLLLHVLDNAERICKVACLDSGKTLVDAQLGEILVTAEKIQWTLAHGEKALRPSRRPTNLLMMYKRNTVHYEPLGVVAALVSWNYPFHNLMGPIISALFAGNGIIVKVSEQTAWSSTYFASIARGALVAHGHDPQLVQTVVPSPTTSPPAPPRA